MRGPLKQFLNFKDVCLALLMWSKQFIVEVDVSDTGGCAVIEPLITKSLPACISPTGSFLWKENMTHRPESSYLSNLEEWRYCLKCAGQPFLGRTDHKNLDCIRSAKRLNSRQARWAMFLHRFRFTLSYWPGNKNVKPDALFRQHQREEEMSERRPPSCLTIWCLGLLFGFEMQGQSFCTQCLYYSCWLSS